MIRTIAALATATLLFTPAAPALAQSEALECVGAKSTSYAPGLTLTPKPQRIAFQATYAPCIGTEESITSARVVDGTSKTASCLSVGEANPGDSVYTWNTGETSTFIYQTTVERPAGQLVTTKRGTITAGKFAGATAVEVGVGVTPDLAECLSAGVKQINSTLTFTIAGL